MKNKYIFIMAFLMLMPFVSCDTDLDKINPNNYIDNTYYKTSDELVKATNAIYAVMQSHELCGREWLFLSDMQDPDVMAAGGHLEPDRTRLINGTHTSSNYVVTQTWRGFYALIHRANVVITKAPDADFSDEDLRARLIREAKFLRAWAYYYLVINWGSVPMLTEPVKAIDDKVGKSSESAVFELIISDLTDAISLPTSYSGSDLGRASSYAARALLARTYMYLDNYPDAKTQLQEIIGKFSLTPVFNHNFDEENEFNVESIFELKFRDDKSSTNWDNTARGDGEGMETTLHSQEFCPTSWRNTNPSGSLLEEFEMEAIGDDKDDPRWDYTIYQAGDPWAGEGPVEAKFRAGVSPLVRGVAMDLGWEKHTIIKWNATDYYPSGLNERLIRYAEVLLMMAECQLETGEDASAIMTTLNEIRNRADVMMPNYPTANYPCDTPEELFRAIAHEKRVELAAEQVRYIDIKRWRRQGRIGNGAGQIPEPFSYFQANKHELLPIPQVEINNNPSLSEADQNPGF